jgi:hypothetical protein
MALPRSIITLPIPVETLHLTPGRHLLNFNFIFSTTEKLIITNFLKYTYTIHPTDTFPQEIGYCYVDVEVPAVIQCGCLRRDENHLLSLLNRKHASYEISLLPYTEEDIQKWVNTDSRLTENMEDRCLKISPENQRCQNLLSPLS